MAKRYSSQPKRYRRSRLKHYQEGAATKWTTEEVGQRWGISSGGAGGWLARNGFELGDKTVNGKRHKCITAGQLELAEKLRRSQGLKVGASFQNPFTPVPAPPSTGTGRATAGQEVQVQVLIQIIQGLEAALVRFKMELGALIRKDKEDEEGAVPFDADEEDEEDQDDEEDDLENNLPWAYQAR